MDDKVFTQPEPLYNVQLGLHCLRETILPLESKFRRIFSDYDQQIEQYIASLSIPERGDEDYETRRKVLARKKANILQGLFGVEVVTMRLNCWHHVIEVHCIWQISRYV